MNAYVDASVILRLLLRQKDQLAEWGEIDRVVVSPLVEVECLRTLDRARHREGLTPEEAAERREAVYWLLEEARVVDLTKGILHRASQPLATPLGTLDAIHLATAQAFRESGERDLVLATHDEALALAARSSGFPVVGVRPAKSTGPDVLELRERTTRQRGVRGAAGKKRAARLER